MKEKTKKIIDSKPIKDLAKLLEELSLTEISYRDGDFSVMVARGARVQTVNSDTQIQDNEGDSIDENDYKNDPKAIKSPMVGTVYLQPEPGANKFVNIGDQVKAGQTLLIVEAMKTMNPIESNLQGKVIKILVENEQAVEFGQPLMLIG
jgi:acetyl-CoA carboxylase biotin carboxyl carrier protein